MDVNRAGSVTLPRLAHDGGFDLAGYPAIGAWVRRVEAELGIGD
jgi:glutathione S-transferase